MLLNKFKMIVTDLDGTYLHDDKTVSTYSQNIINTLRKQGYIFVIATARPVRSVISIHNLEFDAGIFHNGAVLYNKEKYINAYSIDNPYDIVAKILREYNNCHLAVESQDILYANFDSKKIWPETQHIYTQKFDEIKELKADKIIIEINSVEKMKLFEKFLPSELYIQLSENKIAMIMNRSASKINGIQRLASIYNISLNDIVSFGDDYNDIEMLQGTGKGIAVSNALPVVKTVADEICESNNSNGVANWLAYHLI